MKEMTSKKKTIIICTACVLLAAIAAAIIAVILIPPKGYDFADKDFREHVTLSLSDKDRAAYLADYEKEQRENGITSGTVTPVLGASIDFYVTAYLVEDGVQTRYEPFCREESAVESYKLTGGFDFDKCIMYNISSPEDDIAAPRKMMLGKSFSFTLAISEDIETGDIAGKTLRFVVIPISYSAPLVSGDALEAELEEFFEGVGVKDAAAKTDTGDPVLISVVTRVGESIVYSDSMVIILGTEHFFYGFDERLTDITPGLATFSVTFGNIFAEDDAFYAANGKTAEFFVTVSKVYNREEIREKTDSVSDVYELSEALRLYRFAKDKLRTEIKENSKVDSYPGGVYEKTEKYIRYVVDGAIDDARDYLKTFMSDVTDELALKYAEENYFSQEEYLEKDEFIKMLTDDNARFMMIANAAQNEWGVGYSDEDYEADVATISSDTKAAESAFVGGKQYIRAYFILERALDNILESKGF